MNENDREKKRQREFIKQFNSTKTAEQKEDVKDIKSNFLNNKEITKEEYNKLIQYYLNADFNELLNYDYYKMCSYYHMTEQEVQLHNVIIKSCLILG